ncbi:MAG TPA: Rieske 2Fe-2S domain-containing protein [Jiangellaceae bacterium]|nr:Rieske 2Fe-2S domain-containing protein [Jiangellaceae bacterium]
MTISRDDKMSEYTTEATGTELERRRVGDPIPDPGFPESPARLTDTDLKAERRAERQVAGMFGLAAVLVIAFLVFYVIFPIAADEGGVDVGAVRDSNLALGLTLGGSLLLIGIGAIHWARKLMSSHQVIHERHELRSSDETRAATLADFELGAEESGFGRRKLIRNSLIGALLLLPLPAVILLRDLGPAPGGVKKRTIWDTGVRVLKDRSFEPIRPSDLQVGSLVIAMPESYLDLPDHGPVRQNERGKSSVFLIRMPPGEFRVDEGRENWHVDGILCYSKICTHVGCPITLYERDTHHMLCPCHQSTFNLAEGGEVIFGPAKRPLPQLPLAVDDEGYLIAQSDFVDPVGPSFWEMNT